MKKIVWDIKAKRSGFGLAVMLAAAIASFLLALRFFESPHVSAGALFNAGVDVMGIFICAILFFGCIGDNLKTSDGSIKWFMSLVFFTGLSFLNNEILWYFTGSEVYGKYCLLLYSVTKWFDFTLVLFFYLYVRETIHFEDNKLLHLLDKGITALLIPMAALMLLNMFVPICFSVDKVGNLNKEDFYWLIDLYLIIVAPLTTILLMQSPAANRHTSAAFSFILIPIAHYAATGGEQGYATQYGSVLVSIVLMYCILFGDRSKKLATTQHELQTATLIQDSMLPTVFPAFPERPEFELYATMDTAKEVGGDFYDFFLIDEDHLCLIIADVSGKGVPAALFMMVSKVILQSCSIDSLSAADILNKANKSICSNNDSDMFVTVWVGILELSTGKITASNAGHEYPALKKNGTYRFVKESSGLVIGGMEDFTYKDYEIFMEPGDMLFLYTDGVPEATDRDLKMFGLDQMLNVLNKNKDASSPELLRIMKDEVNTFARGTERFDDMTMMCIEYRGPEIED